MENNLTEEYKLIIARQYLKEHGYCPVESLIDDKIFLWIHNGLQEKETTFFLVGDRYRGKQYNYASHYRPTRFSQNPFIKEDGSFAYTYQERKAHCYQTS